MANPNPQNPVTLHSTQLIPQIPTPFAKTRQWLDGVELYLDNCSSTNLSEDKKFIALSNALPTNIREEEVDLTTNSVTKYTDLRNKLRLKFATPVREKFKIFSQPEPMGDRSPSQYLNYIRKGYAAAGVNDVEAIKIAFAQNLPEKYASFVYITDANNLSNLAQQLDGMYKAGIGNIASTNMVYPMKNAQSKEIEELTKKMNDLTMLTHNLASNNTQNIMSATGYKNPNNFSGNSGSTSYRATRPQNQYTQNKVQQGQNQFTQNRFQNPQNQYTQYNHQQQPQHTYRQQASYNPRNVYNNTCPEPPNHNNNYGLCPNHIRYGANTFNCQRNGCMWEQLRIPYHRCNQQQCRWDKYKQKGPNANSWRGGNNHNTKNFV